MKLVCNDSEGLYGRLLSGKEYSVVSSTVTVIDEMGQRLTVNLDRFDRPMGTVVPLDGCSYRKDGRIDKRTLPRGKVMGING